MRSRRNYYYAQQISESELDLGFELLEQADRDLASKGGAIGSNNKVVLSCWSIFPDVPG